MGARRFRLYDKVCTLALARYRLLRVRQTFLQEEQYKILPRSHGNIEDVRSAVFLQDEAKSEPFRMRFAYFSRSISRIQYKKS